MLGPLLLNSSLLALVLVSRKISDRFLLFFRRPETGGSVLRAVLVGNLRAHTKRRGLQHPRHREEIGSDERLTHEKVLNWKKIA